MFYPLVFQNFCVVLRTESLFMTNQLIIGLIFLGILLLFLIIIFFRKTEPEPFQYNILHFLISLCAGFAGGFLAGEALLKIRSDLSKGFNFAFSGTAGFALFVLIWFTYPKLTPKPLTPAFNFRVPDGWTFSQTIEAIAQANNSICSFVGFTNGELNLILNGRELHEKTPLKAIDKLKKMNNYIPDYSVHFMNNTFTITKK